jgi:Patatin-like phospholipase
MNPGGSGFPFRYVFGRELRSARTVREWAAKEGLRTNSTECRLGPHPDMPIGLAFSGGGVRSASFHLGILQSFAEQKLLPYFDYLSAVSGGGFIASWLCNWIRQESLSTVQHKLAPRLGEKEPKEVERLRQHASYLTPRLGLLGEDNLLLITTYLHQWFLASTVLVSVACLILFIPYLVFSGARSVYTSPLWLQEFVGAVGGAMAICATWLIAAFFLRSRRTWTQEFPRPVATWVCIIAVFGIFCICMYKAQVYLGWCWALVVGGIAGWLINGHWERLHTWLWPFQPNLSETPVPIRQACCVWLGFLSSFPIVLTLYEKSGNTRVHSIRIYLLLSNTITRNPDLKVLLGVGVFLLTVGLAYVFTNQTNLLSWTIGLSQKRVFREAKLGIAVVLVGGLIAYTVYRTNDLEVHLAAYIDPKCLECTLDFLPALLAFVVPLCIIFALLVIALVVGIVGRYVTPFVRESCGRMAAQLYRLTLLWTVTAIISFYAPALALASSSSTRALLALVWALSAALSFLLGREIRLPLHGRPRLRNIVMNCAFFLFIGGCWIFLAFVCRRILFGQGYWSGWSGYDAMFHQLSGVSLLCVILGLLVLVLALSSRIGINLSSMHLFYQGCLARAYLNEELPFKRHGIASVTLGDLAVRDDTEKRYDGPILILNATLNITRSEDLSLQERQAVNFVFTPEFCGYEAQGETTHEHATYHAYQRTEDYRYDRSSGIRLAHAMSISGSALSTSMGRNSSSRLRLLHAIFNVRLGWWFCNPGYIDAWTRTLPRARLHLLWKEIRGTTDNHGPFIHLSDGGHFENLGVYELVHRRCSVIVACDASASAAESLSSLADAVTKVRTDLGVDIKIDPNDLVGGKPGNVPAFAVGEIRYDDDPEHNGVFIYIRSVRVDDAPIDLISFGKVHPSFPHDSTVNQWFRESQFESYRQLGYTIGRKVAIELARESVEKHLCAQATTFLKRVYADKQTYARQQAQTP